MDKCNEGVDFIIFAMELEPEFVACRQAACNVLCYHCSQVLDLKMKILTEQGPGRPNKQLLSKYSKFRVFCIHNRPFKINIRLCILAVEANFSVRPTSMHMQTNSACFGWLAGQ